MIKLELIKEILIEYGYNLSDKPEIEDGGDFYNLFYDNIVLEFSSFRPKDEVIGIFISNSIMNTKSNNLYYDGSGVYLSENDGTLTIDKLKKYLEIIKNPIKHELYLLQKYSEMISWVEDELWPVLKFYGYKYESSSLLNPEKLIYEYEDPWLGVSFIGGDNYSLNIGIDRVTGELIGSEFFEKFDLLGKLQFEIYLVIEKIINDKPSSDYYWYFNTDRVH